MDLGRRQADGLERVEQGDGRVRIGGGIDDEAVKHAVGLLHPRHKLTLKIALPDRDRGPGLLCRRADEALEGGIVLAAVKLRLTQAQQVEVRAVQHQNVHVHASRICRTVSSGVPLLSAVPSEKRA